MSKATRALLIGLAVVTVVAVAGALVFIVPAMRDDVTPPTAATPSAAPEALPSSPDNGRSGFGTPVVDILGRKVTVPNNPVGRPIPQTEPVQRTGCTPDGSAVSSPSGVQIQQTAAVPMLVSESDGPVAVTGNVLTGYSRSPQGAALAGWNWLAALYGPGPVAKDAYEQLTVPTAELDAITANERWDSPASAAAPSLPAPVAFHVISCTDDFASIEYAIEVPVDENGQRRTTPMYSVLRAALFHDGVQWKARLDSRSVSGSTDITDITAFTRWALS